MRKDQKAWILIDVGNSAFATTILAALFPIYLPSLFPGGDVQMQIGPWAWTSSPISLWGYAVSISLLIALLMSPILGTWADHFGNRKKAFGIFTVLGALGSAGLGFFDQWQSALICFMIANVGFSGSCIFYNSLLTSVAPKEEWDSLSLKAFAWGYVGGGILLAFNLLLIFKFELLGLGSKKEAVEWSFVSVGVWWILFSLPAFFWIKEERLPIPAGQKMLQLSGKYLRQIWGTLQYVFTHGNLLIFMMAYACFNDGISTVVSMASIYGKEILSLNEESLIGTLLVIQFLGLPFTLAMTGLSKRFGAKPTLLGSLVFWIFIIIYSYFMKTSLDFFILGILVSMVLGVSQALPRSIYARLIPYERQAEFFSFFALSGKMTSVMGPTLFAVVKDISGDARLSILTLGILFLLGLVGLCFVSIDPSKEPALN